MKWDAGKYDSVKAPQVDAGRELIEMANDVTRIRFLISAVAQGSLLLNLHVLHQKDIL